MSDVTIVGAGLAGLCCARRLQQCGISFQILEASDDVGGRVRTDRVDGFLLDRGFQVYLPAYPEGKRALDLPALELKPFKKAALVWYRGRLHRVGDPSEGLLQAALSLVNPIGSPRDKFRVARLKARYANTPMEKLIADANGLTLDELRWTGGFSQGMIERFFRPWLGGVTLDKSLTTSSRLFRFLFRMFAEGGAALPAAGMGAIPKQLAASLPDRSIRLNVPVDAISNGEVLTADGARQRSRAIVVAADGGSAARLLGGAIDAPKMRPTITLYYTADRSPVNEPILVLNGEGQGIVDHLAVVSDAAPSYAPNGKSLISVSIVGLPPQDDPTLDVEVRERLTVWFGAAVRKWSLLAVRRIAEALPDQPPEVLDPWQRAVRLRPGLYVCGDHRDQGSINGAMTSGFRTAQAVAEDLAANLV